MKWMFRLIIVVGIGFGGFRTTIFGMERQPSTALIAYNESCETNEGNYVNKIYVADWQSGVRSVISEQAVAYLPPSWSPDGKQLAYVANNEPPYEIYIREIKNGADHKLPPDTHMLNNPPSWSPDGHSIAFFLAEQVGIYDMLTDQVQNFAILTVNNSPVSAWSPDGNLMAVSGSYPDKPGEMYIINIASGDIQDLSQEQFDLVGHPAWSPDGRYVTFTASTALISAIYLADLQSHTLTKLSKNDAQNYVSSAWSPDGQTIATSTGESNVHLFDRQGNLIQKINLQQQIPGLGGGEGQVKWSPDGNYLSLYAPVNSRWVNYAYNLATGAVTSLSPESNCDYSAVDWQPDPPA